jgi:predicted HTH transcriptional regulator
MINLTDQELLARLRNFEDPFVERKSAGDHKDFIKTAVAFANTLPIRVPGVLFVPATNDGKIQATDLDHLQQKVSERLAQAYPPLDYFQHI